MENSAENRREEKKIVSSARCLHSARHRVNRLEMVISVSQHKCRWHNITQRIMWRVRICRYNRLLDDCFMKIDMESPFICHLWSDAIMNQLNYDKLIASHLRQYKCHGLSEWLPLFGLCFIVLCYCAQQMMFSINFDLLIVFCSADYWKLKWQTKCYRLPTCHAEKNSRIGQLKVEQSCRHADMNEECT